MPKRDVIAIIGTTGVGKTQLAIDLARWVKAKELATPKEAELINADSMQVYRGLNIITNKATKEERDEFPHHLMDILDPGEEYRVDHFRADAMQAVEDIAGRSNLPILVGGTMYFIQHLLFPGRLVSAEEDRQESVGHRPLTDLDGLSPEQKDRVLQLPGNVQELLFKFDTLPLISTPSSFPPNFPTSQLPSELQDAESYTSAVYQCLQAIDPVMAQRWHWRDIRKVSRSLQIFVQTGQLHSEIMKEQATSVQDTQYRTLIFWPYARPESLESRLNARVEKMCTLGLLDELRELRKVAGASQHLDLSKGIYQAIGYKEFADFLAKEEALVDTQLSIDSPEYKQAIDAMQTGTRQYARRQIKWIRNQLLPVIEASKADGRMDDVYLYLLDATDVNVWAENVCQPAEAMIQRFLSRGDMPDPASLSLTAGSILTPKMVSMSRTSITKVQCEICTIDPERPFMVEEGQQMQVHKGSRGHRKRVQKLAKRQHWVPERAPTSATPSPSDEG